MPDRNANRRLRQPLARYETWQGKTTREAREFALAGFPGLLKFRFDSKVGQFLSSAKVVLDALELSTVRSSGHDIWLEDESRMAVLFPIIGTIEVARGLEARAARPSESLIVGTGERRTRLSPSYLGVLLKLPKDTLHARIEQLAQTKPVGLLDGPGFPGDGQLSDTLRRYLMFLLAELDESDRLLQFKPSVATANALLLDLIAAHWLNGPASEGNRQPAPGTWQLKRAEAYMRAHVGRVLSMGDVADHVGVSLRALQLAFQRYRHTTPLGFLAECRLQEANNRLRQAQPGDTVTGVLRSVGVVHLGRFAIHYRTRFGELPSETLGRSRNWY